MGIVHEIYNQLYLLVIKQPIEAMAHLYSSLMVLLCNGVFHSKLLVYITVPEGIYDISYSMKY